eukprot:4067133-Amphidinium_carterae.1
MHGTFQIATDPSHRQAFRGHNNSDMKLSNGPTCSPITSCIRTPVFLRNVRSCSNEPANDHIQHTLQSQVYMMRHAVQPFTIHHSPFTTHHHFVLCRFPFNFCSAHNRKFTQRSIDGHDASDEGQR